MKHRYLEVTFRRGKPLAAYLYLPRALHAKSARTEDAGSGLRVDYAEDGAAIGIEITAPMAVTVAHVNALLARLGVSAVEPEDWAPLHAA